MGVNLLYRIGSDAGFFSEYNNMILAIVYCKRKKWNFLLSSKGANFAYKKGWEDYFQPFCKEWNLPHQHVMNPRYEAPYKTTGKRELIKRNVFTLCRHLLNIDLLTYDIFHKMRSQEVNDILLHECRLASFNIYKYNNRTQQAINERISTLPYHDNYVALHVRRGDKITETTFIDTKEYIKTLQQHSNCKRIFVATDDFAIFRELQTTYPDYEFFTLSREERHGYDQRTFETYPPQQKESEMYNLFADIEMLANAEYFVGTLSSNIGMYLYWRMPEGRCIGVDFNTWKIW